MTASNDTNTGATAALQAHVLGGRQMQLLAQKAVQRHISWKVCWLHLVRKTVHIELDAHLVAVGGQLAKCCGWLWMRLYLKPLLKLD